MQMQLQKITAINHPFVLLFCTTIQDFPQPLVCPWIYFKKKNIYNVQPKDTIRGLKFWCGECFKGPAIVYPFVMYKLD